VKYANKKYFSFLQLLYLIAIAKKGSGKSTIMSSSPFL
jgi:hypothetical protein